MGEQLEMKALIAAKMVDGIEMGILDDGTAYLTGRGLARAIGTTESTIRGQRDEWAGGKRGGKFAKLLQSIGFDEPQLHIPVRDGGNRYDAYTETVVMAFLEYYALDVSKKEAADAYRILARAGFRLYVYGKLGVDPTAGGDGAEFKEFKDRLKLHALPDGYFSVFREMSEYILAAIQNGLRLTFRTIPDISVGRAWSSHWKDNGLEQTHGTRIQHEHYYPDYFPQSASNPQDMWVYPLNALPDYRRWLKNVYITSKFPGYIQEKVKQGLIEPGTAKALLEAISPPASLTGRKEDN